MGGRLDSYPVFVPPVVFSEGELSFVVSEAPLDSKREFDSDGQGQLFPLECDFNADVRSVMAFLLRSGTSSGDLRRPIYLNKLQMLTLVSVECPFDVTLDPQGHLNLLALHRQHMSIVHERQLRVNVQRQTALHSTRRIHHVFLERLWDLSLPTDAKVKIPFSVDRGQALFHMPWQGVRTRHTRREPQHFMRIPGGADFRFRPDEGTRRFMQSSVDSALSSGKHDDIFAKRTADVIHALRSRQNSLHSVA